MDNATVELIIEEMIGIVESEGEDALTDDRIEACCKKHEIDVEAFNDLVANSVTAATHLSSESLNEVVGGSKSGLRKAAALTALLNVQNVFGISATSSQPPSLDDDYIYASHDPTYDDDHSSGEHDTPATDTDKKKTNSGIASKLKSFIAGAIGGALPPVLLLGALLKSKSNELADLQQQLDVAASTASELEAKLTASTSPSDLATLTQQKADLEKQIADLTDQITTQQKEIGQLTKDLNRSKDNLDATRADLQNTSEQLTESRQALEKSTKQLKYAKDQFDTLQKQSATVTKAKTEADEALAAARKTIASYTDTLRSLQTTNQKNCDLANRWAANAKALEAANTQLQAQLRDLTQQLQPPTQTPKTPPQSHQPQPRQPQQPPPQPQPTPRLPQPPPNVPPPPVSQQPAPTPQTPQPRNPLPPPKTNDTPSLQSPQLANPAPPPSMPRHPAQPTKAPTGKAPSDSFPVYIFRAGAPADQIVLTNGPLPPNTINATCLKCLLVDDAYLYATNRPLPTAYWLNSDSNVARTIKPAYDPNTKEITHTLLPTPMSRCVSDDLPFSSPSEIISLPHQPITSIANPQHLSLPKPKIYLCNGNTLSTLQAVLNQKTTPKTPARPCVLNFANPTLPGGGARRGISSQEQGLLTTTTLFPHLISQRLTYYQKNSTTIATATKSGELDQSGSHASFSKPPNECADFSVYTTAVYTPNVKQIKDANSTRLGSFLEPAKQTVMDVISIASCGLTEACSNRIKTLQDTDTERKHYLETCKFAWRTYLHTANLKSLKHLVIGPLGCGKFHGIPEIVAEAFCQVFSREGPTNDKPWSNCFDILSISCMTTDPRKDPSYLAFKNALDRYFQASYSEIKC